MEEQMPRRKKGAVRPGHGAMCNICGKNCGKGGPLKRHIEDAHKVSYGHYKICFYGEGKALANAWDDSVKTSGGDIVVVHVLVRRFVQSPENRPVTRSVPKQTV